MGLFFFFIIYVLQIYSKILISEKRLKNSSKTGVESVGHTYNKTGCGSMKLLDGWRAKVINYVVFGTAKLSGVSISGIILGNAFC